MSQARPAILRRFTHREITAAATGQEQQESKLHLPVHGNSGAITLYPGPWRSLLQSMHIKTHGRQSTGAGPFPNGKQEAFLKYYAVKRGRQPGIYESWSSCQEQIYKFSGAVFKSFEDRAAAEEYLQQEETEQPINDSLPAAYIDGSFSKNSGSYGYGGFISNGRECHIIQGTGSNPEYLTERNIAGELIGTLAVMHKCHELGINEVNLYFDYAGIEEYTTGNWKAKTPLAIYYRDTMELLADLYNLQVHFIKLKGHSGIEGNELADLLAKEATGAQLRKKDIKALAEFRAREGELKS